MSQLRSARRPLLAGAIAVALLAPLGQTAQAVDREPTASKAPATFAARPGPVATPATAGADNPFDEVEHLAKDAQARPQAGLRTRRVGAKAAHPAAQSPGKSKASSALRSAPQESPAPSTASRASRPSSSPTSSPTRPSPPTAASETSSGPGTPG